MQSKYTSIIYASLLSFSMIGQCNECATLEGASKTMIQSVNDYFNQNEPQVFAFWNSLSADDQLKLSSQLNGINQGLLQSQKSLVANPLIVESLSLDPFNDFEFVQEQMSDTLGLEAIKKGRLGCLLLAGGQGTRLKIQGPKGAFPISLIKNKSLFQLIAEKVAAASKWAGVALHIAVMTSPENDEETREFFAQNHYFGLHQDQVDFFIQSTLPFLDPEGHLFLETPSKIATGPDGNGHSLISFFQSGIWEKWKAIGIDYMHLIPIDNPLADPFDSELLGFHMRKNVEISMKCTEKTTPEEKVGVVVCSKGRTSVIEYCELSEAEKSALRPSGQLKHCCANLSLFCFSMAFIKKIAEEQKFLPLHKAWKPAKTVDLAGNSQLSSCPIAWKFETFIFDWLEESRFIAALLYPRSRCFAPLKNFSGVDSPETVKSALQIRDRELLEAITGLPAPYEAFELAADFYYPTDELKAKWKDRVVSGGGYINP